MLAMAKPTRTASTGYPESSINNIAINPGMATIMLIVKKRFAEKMPVE